MNIGEVMSLVFQLAELSKMAPRSELVNHYFRWLQAGCAMMVKAPATGVVSTLRYIHVYNYILSFSILLTCGVCMYVVANSPRRPFLVDTSL